MFSGDYIITSESVTEGHPDKIADQISDAILDEMLKGDPLSRVACETMVTTGLAIVAGEITTSTYVDIPGIIRNTVRDIGYTRAKFGFDYETCGVITSIDKQSPDISDGVDTGGAGDQGLMFGYACDDTEELMPLPIMLAHRLCMRLSEVRKKDILPYLRPDGKSQVTVRYSNFKPVEITTVVLSAQHSQEVKSIDLRDDLIEYVIKEVLPKDLYDEEKIKYYINPTGRFVKGGPMADCGLTGRKIIVDTYGGVAHHGGGCFSGKDPTKVDRSAAYMARYIAKNIVASGVAKRCEIQVAYAIGVDKPVSVMVDTFNTGIIPSDKLGNIILDIFDLSPKKIIEALDLRKPIFKETAAYGHFGRNHFSWEQCNRVNDIKDKI
ncbi:MAG: methionine adenosyltransferase [Deferribacterota bacterium]|nr:methionine adenosyltransferase [Deferribacterota bacterium]